MWLRHPRLQPDRKNLTAKNFQLSLCPLKIQRRSKRMRSVRCWAHTPTQVKLTLTQRHNKSLFTLSYKVLKWNLRVDCASLRLDSFWFRCFFNVAWRKWHKSRMAKPSWRTTSMIISTSQSNTLVRERTIKSHHPRLIQRWKRCVANWSTSLIPGRSLIRS